MFVGFVAIDTFSSEEISRIWMELATVEKRSFKITTPGEKYDTLLWENSDSCSCDPTLQASTSGAIL